VIADVIVREPNPATGRLELRRWRPHATLRILTPIPSPSLIRDEEAGDESWIALLG